jgi:hypothetical protein
MQGTDRRGHSFLRPRPGFRLLAKEAMAQLNECNYLHCIELNIHPTQLEGKLHGARRPPTA